MASALETGWRPSLLGWIAIRRRPSLPVASQEFRALSVLWGSLFWGSATTCDNACSNSKVWLLFWAGFSKDFESGALEGGEILTLEDIAADMAMLLVENDFDYERLVNREGLLCLVRDMHCTLVNRVSEMILETTSSDGDEILSLINTLIRDTKHLSPTQCFCFYVGGHCY